MRVIPMLIFFIAALITIRSAAGQSNTVLYIYPLGSSNTGSTQSVTIGTTIVFSCTIPGLSAYTGTGVFSYTELHAMVGGVDTVICSATSTGACAPGSQGAPYASRSISVDVPTTVGTSFTMTAAVVADSQLSIGYYCKIVAGNVLYSQVPGVTTPLQIYAVANQPTLSFVNSSNAFVSGQSLPNITCSANVGAPYGWLQLTASGFIGTWNTAPYPSYLTLVSNSTVMQSNDTYTMTYTFGYSSGTYTLSNRNNNDYFVCYAYNSYVYQSVTQSGVASSALTIQVQGLNLTQNFTTSTAGAGAAGLNGGGVASVVIAIIVVVINAMYANGDASVYGVPFSSESTTPTANMAAPPAYPGRARAEANANANATTARGNRHDTLPAPNGYGTINSHFGTIDSYVQI